jgi:hypothetical protein
MGTVFFGKLGRLNGKLNGFPRAVEKSPVRMVTGFLLFINLTNSLKTHSKFSTFSSRSSTPVNMTLWKWLFTPTIRPNGISYTLVLYVVSNVIASPK